MNYGCDRKFPPLEIPRICAWPFDLWLLNQIGGLKYSGVRRAVGVGLDQLLGRGPAAGYFEQGYGGGY